MFHETTKHDVAVDPRTMSKNVLLVHLEKAQWLLRLQGQMMEHPVVDGFLTANGGWDEMRDDKGRVLGTRAKFRADYVLPAIPEARLEALETLFERHVSGVLPSTRRRHAKELVALVVSALCTDAAAVAAEPEPGEVPAAPAVGTEAEGAQV